MVTAQVVVFLYPDASPVWDYRLRDNGKGEGARIVFWSENLGKEPTAEALAAVEESPEYVDYLAQTTKRAKAADAADAKAAIAEDSKIAQLVRAAVAVALREAGVAVPGDADLKAKIAAEIDVRAAALANIEALS